ncbi:magnesium transport protein CorA [Parapedobacter defluvii]|uniref:Magnesium transport protein CorA n=1 Tax=Parapedobacter defluvii TaxID=2045106 RepID=A0ABQ1MDL0_9SPHI|nr:CorA family divalent cation transporter [Parapedobacter defluvii]RQP09555.1 MAG: magnesium transporter CorA [Parapedobacter sp.]GGC37382.1 magnesium transport protein CorA [Parapedobacter defluvii]
MVQLLATKDRNGFDWVDLSAPSDEEIREVAAKYTLHEASIKDCMQPDHLPKYEVFDNYTFVIFRVLAANPPHEADTIQELTNKISIFFNADYLITIHRAEGNLIDLVKTKRIDTGKCDNTLYLLNSLIRESILTFEKPGFKLSESLDYYEERVFLRQRTSPILRGLYFVKRKIDVIRRVMLLSYEIVDNIDSPEKSDVYTRDLRDLYVRTQTFFDNLSENTAQLLSMYFSIASQRTNEIMRVLTIFSVFFMPLTFVVGVYGMNFRHMPELDWYYGYPAVMVLMVGISIGIYFWFKRKGWL